MKKLFVRVARNLAPGFILRRREAKFKIRALEIPAQTVKRAGGTLATLECIEGCRYDLWPKQLRHLSAPWTLVDVGANDGHFLRHALPIATPSRVLAIEPLPKCQPGISKALAGHPDARCIQAVAGAHPGTAVLHVTARSDFASVLRPLEEVLKANYGEGAHRVEEKIDAPMVTLDEALRDELRIGLLKIDVQGFEAAVLQGAAKALARTMAVLLEINYIPHYDGAATFAEVHELLTRSGFVLRGVSAPYYHLAQPLWADGVYEREVLCGS